MFNIFGNNLKIIIPFSSTAFYLTIDPEVNRVNGYPPLKIRQNFTIISAAGGSIVIH
jgi:hypothetical protein